MPRYEEVADDLRRRIHSGEYGVGATLPTYADLTATYSVGRGVISSALGVLEREGLIRVVKRAGIRVLNWQIERRRIGRGQAVMRDPARGYVFPAASHAGEPWATHGRPFRSYEPVPDRVAALLDVEPGIAVLRRRRVTSPADEPPFQIVDTWLSPIAVRDAPQVAEANTGPGGYIDRLEESGHGPLSWREHARGRTPTSEEARLLDISPETTVLELTLVGTSHSLGRPVDVTVRVIPADRVELVTELHRDESAQWPVTPVTPQEQG
ncbi:GntR family transcriptional regulator [Streptomyces sp. WMMB303]|uniref:GntR family transcriptional regulator n=1 Tax=unclassified Streptomyces TaxID=2593676 RepID=UPI0023ED4932|nr:GntR family transcriptional regulator [Streptomyces sp. WMMB303]MDF4254715.1 GntR family transcriptional regulator [Streptomyces sp. WMMB303]